jgi:hypothetical protein
VWFLFVVALVACEKGGTGVYLGSVSLVTAVKEEYDP